MLACDDNDNDDDPRRPTSSSIRCARRSRRSKTFLSGNAQHASRRRLALPVRFQLQARATTAVAAEVHRQGARAHKPAIGPAAAASMARRRHNSGRHATAICSAWRRQPGVAKKQTGPLEPASIRLLWRLRLSLLLLLQPSPDQRYERRHRHNRRTQLARVPLDSSSSSSDNAVVACGRIRSQGGRVENKCFHPLLPTAAAACVSLARLLARLSAARVGSPTCDGIPTCRPAEPLDGLAAQTRWRRRRRSPLSAPSLGFCPTARSFQGYRRRCCLTELLPLPLPLPHNCCLLARKPARPPNWQTGWLDD